MFLLCCFCMCFRVYYIQVCVYKFIYVRRTKKKIKCNISNHIQNMLFSRPSRELYFRDIPSTTPTTPQHPQNKPTSPQRTKQTINQPNPPLNYADDTNSIDANRKQPKSRRTKLPAMFLSSITNKQKKT